MSPASPGATARCVVLFTKPARPGRVKTRLIGALTAADAAALHGAFLADVSERLRGGSFHLRLAWALEPGEAVPAGGDGVRQEGADLGERLYGALAAAARDFAAVAAVGSDHPELPLATVEEAFERLAGGADAVVGPALDGGYYLIALSRPAVRRELFTGVPWSSERVLAATLDRCRRLGLAVELLAPAADVDRPADLERLAARLAREELGCPHTRALLAAWGRLGGEATTA